VPEVASAAQRILILLGIGFLAANLKAFFDVVRYYRRRRGALLTWRGEKPRYDRTHMLLAITLGLLLAAKLVRGRPDQAFGEAMMFVYYACAFPLTTRIARGFYGDGIWSDSGFMRWGQISAVSWKEEGKVSLILISHFRQLARRLDVPAHLYGQARRLLRDKIRDQALHMDRAGLDLGSRDDEDTV
jgi:hypothetical protein